MNNERNHKFLEYHGMSAQDFLDLLSADFSEFKVSAPIDVYLIARLLNVKISEDIPPFLEDINTVGSLSIKSDRAVIWVNPLQNEYEQRGRFTIAHELGHLILHIDPDAGIKEFIDTEKTLTRQESFWNTKEYQANNFAAQLLMPVDLIDELGNIVISEHKEEAGQEKIPKRKFIIKMKGLFGVSEPAMTFRLKNIGAIK